MAVLTCSMISSGSTDLPWRRTTNAFGRSPQRSSGTPTTAASGAGSVLGAVAELDVAVRVHDPEVTRVVPAAGERRGRRLVVAVVAAHDVVAVPDGAAHGRAGGRDVHENDLRGVEVLRKHLHDPHRVGLDHPDALAGLQPGPLSVRELRPRVLPLAHRVR